MQIILTVIAGPHKGLEFTFDRHDTFLVGRSKHAHFQLPAKDRYFSRMHFMIEVNPPQCRLIDMGSHNGTFVNGTQVLTADLKEGDQIRAGHTVLRLQVKQVSDELAYASTENLNADGNNSLPSVPGYHVERELGRGAMGATYLGQRLNNPTLYAIKVVQPAFIGSPSQIETFLRAARALVKLDHPNIVRLYDVGTCPSGFYFVTEFVPGVSAEAILQREGPLAIKRVVRWADRMMRALQYAHGKHVIHRDIKPTNVLIAEIDGKEVVKLADFGVACVYQAAPFSGLSLTAAMLDLASFIPPEVIFNFQEINPLADQYSLAAVLYHLLSGADVLETSKEERNRYTSLLRRMVVPLRERRPEVPPALADVIHKALSRTPALRFADIAAFREAMIQAMQGS